VGGILVVNTIDETASVRRALAELLPHRLELRIDDFENRVLAASTRPLAARTLRAAMARDLVLGDAAAARLLLRTRAKRERRRGPPLWGLARISARTATSRDFPPLSLMRAGFRPGSAGGPS